MLVSRFDVDVGGPTPKRSQQDQPEDPNRLRFLRFLDRLEPTRRRLVDRRPPSIDETDVVRPEGLVRRRIADVLQGLLMVALHGFDERLEVDVERARDFGFLLTVLPLLVPLLRISVGSDRGLRTRAIGVDESNRELADPDLITVVERRLGHMGVVESGSIPTPKISHLPHGIGQLDHAVTPAQRRVSELNLVLGKPSNGHRITVELQPLGSLGTLDF